MLYVEKSQQEIIIIIISRFQTIFFKSSISMLSMRVNILGHDLKKKETIFSPKVHWASSETFFLVRLSLLSCQGENWAISMCWETTVSDVMESSVKKEFLSKNNNIPVKWWDLYLLTHILFALEGPENLFLNKLLWTVGLSMGTTFSVRIKSCQTPLSGDMKAV